MPDRSRRWRVTRRNAEHRGRRVWRTGTVVAATVAAIASTAMLANAIGRDGERDARVDLDDLGVPDIVLYNGKISTVDQRNTVVEAIAVRDGEILATGRSRSRGWDRAPTSSSATARSSTSAA